MHSKSHGGDSSGGGMHHGNSKSHGGDSGGKHHGDMSHMDTDDDSDDSQDWWHSKSWRKESWWGKHMSRHGGWKMRTSGRTFGNGQGIRAAKCMLRECGMELQKCRFDMTCRQGVKCAVGEDPSRALSGFPRRVPSGLSAPVSSQPHVFPRRSLSLKPRKKNNSHFWLFSATTLTKGCGFGGDDDSRACSLDCVLENRSDVSSKLFECLLVSGCMPEM
jgi:hypothetical protein